MTAWAMLGLAPPLPQHTPARRGGRMVHLHPPAPPPTRPSRRPAGSRGHPPREPPLPIRQPRTPLHPPPPLLSLPPHPPGTPAKRTLLVGGYPLGGPHGQVDGLEEGGRRRQRRAHARTDRQLLCCAAEGREQGEGGGVKEGDGVACRRGRKPARWDTPPPQERADQDQTEARWGSRAGPTTVSTPTTRTPHVPVVRTAQGTQKTTARAGRRPPPFRRYLSSRHRRLDKVPSHR